MFNLGSGRIRIYNAPSPQQTIEELNEKVVQLTDRAEAVMAQADADGQPMTAEQQGVFDSCLEEADATRAEIARRERLIDSQAKLAIPRARQTIPVGAPVDDIVPPAAAARMVAPAAAGRSNISGGFLAGSSERTFGFRSMGEFAQKVKAAIRGNVDPRLVANAPSTYGNEGTGADGGFAVPPEYRASIQKKVMGEASLLSRCDQNLTSSNQLTVPIDETTPWQTSGGILAYWEAEAAQITQSKPKFDQATVRANKLAVLVPVTEELMEDSPALSSYLQSKVPEKMDFKINDAIINGSGVGQPLGILNADCLVEVDADGSQASNTITFGNIQRMYNRMYWPCRSNAVWICNQDAEAQLAAMGFPTAAAAVPVYLPPGGLSSAPYSTLMGRPVISTEACPVLGDVGDIIFADLSKYMALVKSGGIRSEMSMHLWFDFDTTAFRFIFRVGGQPWWKASITRTTGSNNELSCFTAISASGR